MGSNLTQIGLAAGLAAALFIGAAGLHLAFLPRGSIATIRELKPGTKAGFGMFIYFSGIYWTFATTLFRLHPKFGNHWSEILARWSTTLFCINIAEVFMLAAAAIVHPPLKELAGAVWLGALVSGTVLAAVMMFTLVEAGRVRRAKEEKKVLENLAFLEEAR